MTSNVPAPRHRDLWVQRLLNDKLLLAIAAIAAGIVTLLEDTPAIFWLGHQLGTAVSWVAYAYIGSWIFNWVIVSRPRSAHLRAIYQVAWPALSRVSKDGYYLVRDLAYMADPEAETLPEDADIREIVNKINANAPPPHTLGNRPIDLIRKRIEDRNTALGSVSGLLNFAEPDLLVLLAKVNACALVVYPPDNPFEHLGNEPAVAWNFEKKEWVPIPLANQVGNRVQEYFAATEELRKFLEGNRFRPGPLGPGVDYTFILKGSWQAS